MTLTAVDWAIIAAYFVVTLFLGLAMRGRATQSLVDYFVSGRAMPWWLAGTSMVATTFAADTPLAVTGLVAKNGIAGNWFWWAFLPSGMLTVFVFAAMWRRTEVVTDVELVGLRYSGSLAKWLRVTRAVYLAAIVNSIVIGWVTGAMLTFIRGGVLSSAVDPAWDFPLIVACILVVGVYSVLSGLWGVAVTDFLQFVLAMAGCIWLAVVAVGSVGGLDQLVVKLQVEGAEGRLAFLPALDGSSAWMPLHLFLIYLLVQWWASWYPGAEPGGGGYIVQRMASCRSEREAVLATIWFQFANYALRPWPWILVALVALVAYPELLQQKEPGIGYVWIVRDVSPVGLRGMMVVTFFAAFMSTLSTLVNCSASYLVRDVYEVFRPGESPRKMALVSQVASALVLVMGAVAAYLMRGISIDQAWKMLAALGAGTGAVFIARWFWWRITALTELVAMVGSFVLFLITRNLMSQKLIPDMSDEVVMAIVAGLTVLLWLAATLLLPAPDPRTLVSFFEKARPPLWGWKPVAAFSSQPQGWEFGLVRRFVAAMAATAMTFLSMYAIGWYLLGPAVGSLPGGVAAMIAVLLAVALYVTAPRWLEPPPAAASEAESLPKPSTSAI